MPKTINDLIVDATNQLTESDTARLDAESLLQHALKCDRSYLYSHSEQTISDQDTDTFKDLIAQRHRGWPIAYLTGQKEFWSLDFNVSQNVLIPRPETELLVESALKTIPTNTQYNILELGTGSGAISIAIASERKNTNITAIDICNDALNIARGNARKLGVENIEFKQSDWFQGIDDKHFDMIVCNPPYISSSDPHLLQGDVRFEPKQALVSEKGGLGDLELIIRNAHGYLKENGYFITEHGYDQGNMIRDLMIKNNYQNIEALFDLAHHHRATLGKATSLK